MVLSTKLELRQTQTLVITPQLQQAIRLLQLSNLELQTFLEHEIEQNPFVEWDDTPGEDGERAGNGAIICASSFSLPHPIRRAG